MIEFMPWYHVGSTLLRCSGDRGCGALVVSGDTEVHLRWHEEIGRSFLEALEAIGAQHAPVNEEIKE